MKILVTGATGYVGRLLAKRLNRSGYDVRVLVRDPRRLDEQIAAFAEVVTGDALDRDSLRTALRGVDAAYYLIHSMAAGEKKFVEMDKLAAENFGLAAKETGVGRIIYLGGLGTEAQALSPHLASRQQTGRRLAAGGVPVTEFRAGSIIGSGSLAFEILRYLSERLPLMICPRWVRGRTQPIAVDDVLRYLTECLDKPETAGRVLEIGGADIISYGEMMRTYAGLRGLRRFQLHLPILTPRLSAYWVGFVTPLPARIARPIITGIRNELFCRDDSARDIFPFEPLGFEEAVRRALGEPREGLMDSERIPTTLSSKTNRRKDVTVTHAEGLIVERMEARAPAPPEKIFSLISDIPPGGRPWGDRIWRFRMFVDRLLGGRAAPRVEKHGELREGDRVDFWRVAKLERNRLLRLTGEDLRLPGRVWLQYRLAPDASGTKISQEVYFEPKGLAGVAYWYLLYPFHRFAFRRMLRKLARKAAQ